MRKVVWPRLLVAAVVLLTLLPGCASISRRVSQITRNPMADMEKQLGVPLLPLGTDTNPFGTIAFYEYRKGDQCGFGYEFAPGADAGGSGGSGAGPCVANPPALELGGGGSSGGQNQVTLSLFYGRVRDPKAVKVTVGFPGTEKPIEARVVGTVWYVMVQGKLDGKGPFDIKAYDQAGALLHSNGPDAK